MNDSIYRISLDIHEHGSQSVLKAKKTDTGRKLHISLRAGGTPYIIEDDCYAVFKATKPDDSILYNACTIENNEIVYEFTEQTCTSVGRCRCEIALYGLDNKLITSPRFSLLVDGTIYPDGSVESTDEFSALTDLVGDTLKFIDGATKATNDANEATEATNVATSNAIQATESANLASAEATQSAQSANTATENANEATSRANEATQSANSATSNANLATERANQAATKATQAAQNANIATESANEAAGRANMATESANSATSSANQATTAATQATQNAITATENANGATNRANEATQAAITATNNANQASEIANETVANVAYIVKRTMVAGEVAGESVSMDDAVEFGFIGCRIFGKTTQDGTPTPDAPVELVSVGDSGSITVNVTGENDAQSMTIATPNGLPGIPVTSGGNYTDANNQQWICDEIDFARGVYVKRINVVGFDTAKGERIMHPVGSNLYRFAFTIHNNPTFLPSSHKGGMCNALTYNYSPIGNNTVDNTIFAYLEGGVFVRCDKFGTIGDFMAWAKNINLTFQYALATPIETPLSEEELAAFANLHTYKDNTTVSNDAGAYMELEYVMDAKKYIDSMISTAGIIPATVE